ncbi:hypothetical protein ACOSP7_021800 [Xanthoceras sorbifolium]
MKFDVEVISREIIKPATSTPDHLHHFKYSLVDQLISSSFYTPLIYFYSLDHKLSNNEKSSHLKTSLSQVLNHFYPLAGVIKDNYVDCKNGGVLVLEAQVNCQLSQILQNPHPGSAITIISSHNDPEEEGYDHGLVNKLREAIHKFGKDFAKKHKEGIFDLYSKEVFEDKTLDIGELVFFNCSSFCRFPFYEADFGWGKPMWVTFGDLSARNYTILMDTRNGDGIEAWIHLTEEQMANFETDKQLLTYASSTPCP